MLFSYFLILKICSPLIEHAAASGVNVITESLCQSTLWSVSIVFCMVRMSGLVSAAADNIHVSALILDSA